MIAHDLHIAGFLLNVRSKGDFKDFTLKELGYEWDGSAEMKVQLLQNVYSKEDATNTHSPIFDLEMKLLPVLAEAELQGIRIDRKKLADIGSEISDKIKSLEGEIYEIVGENFNISSPKQIQELFGRLGIPLTKKNKTGYSVDTEVLEEISKSYDIARLILEHRTLSKLQSTYIEGLTKAIDKSDKIHTSYNQLGSSTGRLSSENPNLQNIPTGVGYGQAIKSCFLPTGEEHILIVADYSQIELRVLAFLSGDAELIDTFDRSEDIHMRTAHFIFGENKEITSDLRRIAKGVNFGVIYGITGFGLAKMINASPAEANIYIHTFFSKYPGVRTYYETILAMGRERGYVETYFGRRRYISGLNDANKTVRSIAEREAINMPVQGTAADIIKFAMVDIDAKIRERGFLSRLVLQVHDELVFDVPKDEEEEFTKLIRESMEGVLDHAPVDILVDIHSGDNWSKAKK